MSFKKKIYNLKMAANRVYNDFVNKIISQTKKLPASFKNEDEDYKEELTKLKKELIQLVDVRILTKKETFDLIFLYMDFMCASNLTQRLITKTECHIDDWLLKIKLEAIDKDLFECAHNITNWSAIRNYEYFKDNGGIDEKQNSE